MGFQHTSALAAAWAVEQSGSSSARKAGGRVEPCRSVDGTSHGLGSNPARSRQWQAPSKDVPARLCRLFRMSRHTTVIALLD